MKYQNLFAVVSVGLLLCAASLKFAAASNHGSSDHGSMVPAQMSMTNMTGHMGNMAHGLDPAGVIGNNMPAGMWMLNYQYMNMWMEGSRIGTDSVSPEFIVSTVPNSYPGPPTLRVVPTEMSMDMHMAMAMYAPTDWLTLMAMGTYVRKDMKHVTFQGAAGTTRLGDFTTQSEGIGDTTIASIFKLYDDGTHRFQMSTGVSLPTGSITKDDTVLAPTGAAPKLRLPYSMQLGVNGGAILGHGSGGVLQSRAA